MTLAGDCAGLARAPSSGRSCHPLELNQPADVVAEAHHPDLEPRPRDGCARSCRPFPADGRIRARHRRTLRARRVRRLLRPELLEGVGEIERIDPSPVAASDSAPTATKARMKTGYFKAAYRQCKRYEPAVALGAARTQGGNFAGWGRCCSCRWRPGLSSTPRFNPRYRTVMEIVFCGASKLPRTGRADDGDQCSAAQPWIETPASRLA